MRQPKIGEKIKINGVEHRITSECMGLYYARPKFARQDIEIDLDNIEYLSEPKVKKVKKIKEKPPVKITREERGMILRNLVEPDSLRDNFQREIMILARLVRKFPHKEFLLEGFRPEIKASSLLYWIDRPEVEKLYKIFAISLTQPQKEIKLEDEKVGEDIQIERRPRNLLELLS